MERFRRLRGFSTVVVLTAGILGAPWASSGASLDPAKRWTADNGNGTYSNPLFFEEFEDPDVIRVGDDYYLAGTTMHMNPGVQVMHSRDLVNWELASYSIDRLDLGPAYRLEGGNIYGRGIWAPCLRYHDGTFYVFSNVNNAGCQVFRSRTAQGPWERNQLPGMHDLSVLFDDDGKIYAISGGRNPYPIVELDRGLTAVVPGVRHQMDAPGLGEGHHLYKIKGKYYDISAIPGGNTDQMVARADSIDGPWVVERMVQGESLGVPTQAPLLPGRRANPNDRGLTLHQGGMVDTPSGEWWSIIMQDHGSIGRMVALVPITWDNDFPLIGLPGNLRKAPNTWIKPNTGQVQEPRPAFVHDDSFDSGKLNPHWQWNHAPDDGKWSLTEKPGMLRLHSLPASDFYMARNTLCQRPPGPECTVTVEMDASGLTAGDAAGLALLSSPYAWIGLVKTGESTTLKQYDDTHRATATAPAGPAHLWLRVACNFDSDQAIFSWSADGKGFTPLGDPFTMTFQLRTFQGVRPGLFNFNTTGQPGGHADFDDFTVDEPRASGIERTIPLGKTITLTSGADGSFLATDAQGTTLVSLGASGTNAAPERARFQVIDLGKGRVALEAGNGRFVSAGSEGVALKDLAGSAPGTAESFQWVNLMRGDTMMMSLTNHRSLATTPGTPGPVTVSATGPRPDRQDGACFRWNDGGMLTAAPAPAPAAAPPPVPAAPVAARGKIAVEVDKPGARFHPLFYGLMTEEINHSYDGGLYAELIQNRSFRNTRGPRGPSAELPDARPVDGVPCWYLVTSSGADGAAVPDTGDPVTPALTTSLKLSGSSVPAGGRVGVANTGYWGIPARPDTTYRCSFHAKASDGFAGPLTVAIESNDGKTVHASATVPAIVDRWQRYAVTLKTGQLAPSAGNRFVISTPSKGTVNLNLVSLFPPVFQERSGAALGGRPTTGFRPDIMKLLDDMRPAFLRFPGGNYVEGSDFANHFDFKTTIGPWEQRPGHQCPWGYRSSDGMGLLEFLEWCEELKMEPVLAVYAGLNLDNGRDVKTGEALKPLIQDALDEIQYITGDSSTDWGARRARDGHPAPFKLTYLEIGNEDFLNRGTATYRGPEGRFAMFYNAIKARYPEIQVVATTSPGEGVKLDVIDNHHYMPPSTAIRNAHLYDNADRNGPKIMEGEWASQEAGGPGAPRPLTPTFQCALSDAAFLTGLERNADIVIMTCYAPLFARLEPGGSQWRTNLIGYNGLASYGSPPYYVQKMFFNARGDKVLPITAITPQTIPTPAAEPPPPAPGPGRRGGRGIAPPDPREPIFACASKEDSSGDIILKVVNVFDIDQTLTVELVGAGSLKGAAGQVLVGEPNDTNTADEPFSTVPKDFVIDELSSPWTHTFPDHSITVIRFKTR